MVPSEQENQWTFQQKQTAKKIPDKIAAFQKWFKQHLPTSSNHFRIFSAMEELFALSSQEVWPSNWVTLLTIGCLDFPNIGLSLNWWIILTQPTLKIFKVQVLLYGQICMLWRGCKYVLSQ